MFRIFKRSSTGERLLFVLSIIFILVQVNLELRIPSYMAEITTLLQTPGTVTADILKPGFTMIGLSLLSFASAYY